VQPIFGGSYFLSNFLNLIFTKKTFSIWNVFDTLEFLLGGRGTKDAEIAR
jgi:hypothetical protein